MAALLIAKPHLPFGDAEAFTDRVLRAGLLREYGDRNGRRRRDTAAGGGTADGAGVERRISAMTSPAETVHHPFFARIWPAIAAHETERMRESRRENLAGLSGRVLEVGAGTGTNFAFYPDTVEQVVAIEPEQRLVGLAREAAAAAPVPVEVDQPDRGEFLGRRAVRRGGVLVGAVLGC